ncbi:MAG: glycosyltransferase [Alphaproteobacteria bacterium]|nr:glycosyltransferase [Alphaproteobacteria bacterium]
MLQVDPQLTGSPPAEGASVVLTQPVVRLDSGHGAVWIADSALAARIVTRLADPRIDAYGLENGGALLIVPLPAAVTSVAAVQLRMQDAPLTLTLAHKAVVTPDAVAWTAHPRLHCSVLHAALNHQRRTRLEVEHWPPLPPPEGLRRMLVAPGVLYLELDVLPDHLRLGRPGEWSATVETGAVASGGWFLYADRPEDPGPLVLMGRDGIGGTLALDTAEAGLLQHLASLDAVQHLRQREALGRLAVRTGTPEIATVVAESVAAQALAPRIELRGERVLAALDLALPVEDAVLVVGRLDPALPVGDLALMPPSGTALTTPVQRLLPGRAEIGVLAPIDTLLAPACRQVRGQLLLPSGQMINLLSPLAPEAADQRRAAILAAAPVAAWTPAAIATLFGPALAVAQAAFVKTVAVEEEVSFGQAPRQPILSVIIPLYQEYHFLRPQLLSFAGDPDREHVELIYVLDQPKDRASVEHLLQGLSRVFGVACRLLVLSRNGGYAVANNLAVEQARGTGLVLMNSDVVPTRPGWTGRWWQRHCQITKIGASGPRLLYADGSLQHAGLFFEAGRQPWFTNNHYFKGYPADFPPALTPRAVPGVTGACLMVERALYRSVGGFDSGYVIGDFEDSDLCLRLRADGRTIHYDPGETLFHMERSSIRHHAGYAETAVARYNGWRQTHLWGDAITQLMTAFAGEGAA